MSVMSAGKGTGKGRAERVVAISIAADRQSVTTI